MIFYAHRGNTRGPSMFENDPFYIVGAIGQKFTPEVDVWCVDGELWFGHDGPDYAVKQEWMRDYARHCIFHCKNWEALEAMQQDEWHYFWHQADEYTLTSSGLVWVYPGRPSPHTGRFIECAPNLRELPSTWLNNYGICSDYVAILREEKEAL